MSSAGSKITRFLSDNQYQAAVAANAPTALNPFATIADLSAFVTSNIYTANGTLTGARTISLGGNSLTIDTSGATDIIISAAGNITATSSLLSIGQVLAATTTSGGYTFTGNSTTQMYLVSAGIVAHRVVGTEVLRYVNTGGVRGLSINSGATPTAGLDLVGYGATLATTNQLWRNSGLTTLMTLRDDGRLGINASPSTANRVNITAGAGLDGAIQITSTTVADGGYAIYANGGTTGSNYNGIWSEVNSPGTGTNMAIRAISGGVAGARNYGVYGNAKNGTAENIGVYGICSGGDTVGAGSDSIGVYGLNQSTIPTTRHGVWGVVSTDVAGGISYAGRFQSDAAGAGAVNYGVHSRVNGGGSGRTNYAGWFQADGGSSATNYALVTNGGNVGIGTTTPVTQALVELSSTTQGFLIMRMTAAQASAITTPPDGLGLYVTTTDATFLSVGFYKREGGLWLPW